MKGIEIDLNADIGEGFAFDQELVRYASSLNVACGGHVGDSESMRQAVRCCREGRKSVGAHPSYPDLIHFGRRAVAMSTMSIVDAVEEQVTQLRLIADEEGVRLFHVKPHGALYHELSRNENLSNTYLERHLQKFSDLALYAMAGSSFAQKAIRFGLRVIGEGFVDRMYQERDELVSRESGRSLLIDPPEMLDQALSLISGSVFRAAGGNEITVEAQTLCLHGDHDGAGEKARYLFQELKKRGVTVTPPSKEASKL